MSEPEIRREITGDRGRYVISYPEGEAELTLSGVTETRAIADHTGVPKALEGRGIASRLVRRAVEDARTEGRTLVPLCPYVKAWAQRHPDDAKGVVSF